MGYFTVFFLVRFYKSLLEAPIFIPPKPKAFNSKRLARLLSEPYFIGSNYGGLLVLCVFIYTQYLYTLRSENRLAINIISNIKILDIDDLFKTDLK